MAPGQALQGWLHLLQAPAQVLARLQAHGRHLDQQGMHARGNHGLQEELLRLMPHVGQGHQAQASAHLPGKQVQLSGAQQFEKHGGAGQRACRQAGAQPGDCQLECSASATAGTTASTACLSPVHAERRVDTAGRLRSAHGFRQAL